ncbi:TapB family protein [Leeuwenhoekiella parthenopeia]|uniref:DUF3108 domain-containing protein n=1 Tax=Leeuwenhoekiella parthenopeia TaxID=2890320 RepID=A0ABS8GSY3_9FLAO|nr:hypothetical protein [Leeuwenhoekiella parthenopeia]MCC4212853.1 hypothetical protein [Leeuwenhoekiella parthenopeia]
MKTIFNLLAFVLIPLLAKGQSQDLTTDVFSNISNLSYTTYNAENQITSETFYRVTSSFNTLTGKKIMLLADVKPLEDPSHSTYNYLEQNSQCMTLGIKNILPGYMFDSYSNMQLNIESGTFEIPVDFYPGQQLPDAQLTISLRVVPIVHTLEYTLKNRRFTKREVLNTSAGTFECFVVESITHITPQSDEDGRLKQWFAPGIGLVKQMHYTKNGEMTGLTLLTGINTSETNSGFVQN